MKLFPTVGVLDKGDERVSGHESYVVSGLCVFGAWVSQTDNEMHNKNYGMCCATWSMIRSMKIRLTRYMSWVCKAFSKVQKSLPMMVSGLLLIAFGMSLCLEYAVQWAMKGPLWHGLLLVVAAVGVVWVGQIALHFFAGAATQQKKEETPPMSGKNEKQNLAFPFDILAGHHCAVLVSFDSPLPKTYLIPNLAQVVPNTQPEGNLTGGAVIEKTVGQLRHKGYPIQVLRPERVPATGYLPFMGNPSHDLIRVHPFDRVFVNWN